MAGFGDGRCKTSLRETEDASLTGGGFSFFGTNANFDWTNADGDGEPYPATYGCQLAGFRNLGTQAVPNLFSTAQVPLWHGFPAEGYQQCQIDGRSLA